RGPHPAGAGDCRLRGRPAGRRRRDRTGAGLPGPAGQGPVAGRGQPPRHPCAARRRVRLNPDPSRIPTAPTRSPDMHQWYLSYDGRQIGPLDHAAAVAQAAKNPDGHCWRQGFAEWIPISACNELRAESAPGALPVPAPPPATAGHRRADLIDYRIYGEDMQFVEVELDPGESAVAEAGSLMYKDAAVSMETVFGDGGSSGGSFMDKLVGAGKRLITGESLFTTVFTHAGTSGKARVAFAAPYPGTIVPMTLSNYGGTIIAQKDSFLCAARGVQIGLYFQKKVMTALFGGEGFIMQKLTGD